MPKKYTRKNRRRRFKIGGDIESGIVEDITPMTNIPPDPERFKKQQEQLVLESLKPISKEEAAAVFAGPTPEEREKINARMMMDEDPQYNNPYASSDFKIFSDKGGRRTRKRRRHRKRRHISRRR